jgi:hypothetical protein
MDEITKMTTMTTRLFYIYLLVALAVLLLWALISTAAPVAQPPNTDLSATAAHHNLMLTATDASRQFDAQLTAIAEERNKP